MSMCKSASARDDSDQQGQAPRSRRACGNGAVGNRECNDRPKRRSYPHHKASLSELNRM